MLFGRLWNPEHRVHKRHVGDIDGHQVRWQCIIIQSLYLKTTYSQQMMMSQLLMILLAACSFLVTMRVFVFLGNQIGLTWLRLILFHTILSREEPHKALWMAPVVYQRIILMITISTQAEQTGEPWKHWCTLCFRTIAHHLAMFSVPGCHL